jgi:hypothetical protein
MNKGLLAEKARLTKELEDIAKVQEEADESLAKAIRKAVSPYHILAMCMIVLTMIQILTSRVSFHLLFMFMLDVADPQICQCFLVVFHSKQRRVPPSCQKAP